MARANQRSTDTPRDAVALLKADHRNIEQLFEQFADADETQQSALATRICELLTVRSQIEEEILYPAARQAFEADGAEDIELVNEANVEHGMVRELIAKIEAMTPEHEGFRATVTVLGEYTQLHLKKEETRMLTQLRDTELDLRELGTQLFERKVALMEELGIEDEPIETPRVRTRPTRNTTARSGARRNATSRTTGRSARH